MKKNIAKCAPKASKKILLDTQLANDLPPWPVPVYIPPHIPLPPNILATKYICFQKITSTDFI